MTDMVSVRSTAYSWLRTSDVRAVYETSRHLTRLVWMGFDGPYSERSLSNNLGVLRVQTVIVCLDQLTGCCCPKDLLSLAFAVTQ